MFLKFLIIFLIVYFCWGDDIVVMLIVFGVFVLGLRVYLFWERRCCLLCMNLELFGCVLDVKFGSRYIFLIL